MRKTKKRLKKQNLIIFINIVILIIITCFYAFRLVHYYRVEHPKVEKASTVSSVITLKKNVVTFGDGLYKVDDGYVFKGTEVNNHIKYSGRLWRIVSIDHDGNMKMITDDSQTLLAWGTGEYESSYIRNWLNRSDKNGAGVFYNSLNSPDKYLKNGSWCVDKLKEKENKCNDKVEDLVGLLSKGEYEEALGQDSYLNIGSYWWTSNKSKDGVWYVYSKGKVNDVSNTSSIYYSYGVRPVVILKSSVALLSGDGTSDNPYIIEGSANNVLNLKNVGDYVNYSGMTFRIIEKDFNYIKLALDGFIKDGENDLVRSFGSISNVFAVNTGIGYYLNNTFYNSLDNNDYLLDGVIYTNRYDITLNYDYTKIRETSINVKVGLLQIGDLFINDYKDYFLGTRTSTYDGTVYKVIDEGKVYADLFTNQAKVRPVIFVKPDLDIVSGTGIKSDPYKLK